MYPFTDLILFFPWLMLMFYHWLFYSVSLLLKIIETVALKLFILPFSAPFFECIFDRITIVVLVYLGLFSHLYLILQKSICWHCILWQKCQLLVNRCQTTELYKFHYNFIPLNIVHFVHRECKQQNHARQRNFTVWPACNIGSHPYLTVTDWATKTYNTYLLQHLLCVDYEMCLVKVKLYIFQTTFVHLRGTKC